MSKKKERKAHRKSVNDDVFSFHIKDITVHQIENTSKKNSRRFKQLAMYKMLCADNYNVTEFEIRLYSSGRWG